MLLLLGAAILEAGGDAIVRAGLHGSGVARGLLLMVGGIVLFGYGCFVNAPPWDFGRLLGIYVVLFFLVAQIIGWVVFKQPPTLPITLGGILIVSGGLVISLWKA